MSNIHGKNARIEIHDLREEGVWECPTIETITCWGSMHTSKLHTHENELELCFLAQGRRTYIDGKRTCMMHGGNVWRNAPNEPHSSVGRPSGSSRFFCLHLLPPEEGKLWCGLGAADAQRVWEILMSLDPGHLSRENAGLAACFDFIFSLLRGERMDNFEVLLRMAFNSLITSFVGCALLPPPTVQCNEKVQELIDYINSCDPRVSLEVKDLVKRVDISSSYFVNMFQKVMGETPGQYIFARRIESAAKHIAAGESIKNVTRDYNYDSTQHFTRSFGRYFLETPHKYFLRTQAAISERDRGIGM